MRTRALLEFLLIGALLFGLRVWLTGGANAAPAPIRISAARVAELRREALARSGRLPDAAELDALLQQEIADELLYREALDLGLAARDAVVERRLLQNMRFLRDDAGGDPAELVREARALGMERSDLVVRRRLIERMRLAIEERARQPEPGEAELAAYLAEHPERFAIPPRVRFSQIFFSSSRRPGSAEADAAALLAGLRVDGAGAPGAGDPFLAPRDLPLESPGEIARIFGPEFAQRLLGLPVGAWVGPIRSSHGHHLVRVHERVAGGLPPLAAVRDAVRYGVLAERGERELRDAVAAARGRYRVEVQPAAN